MICSICGKEREDKELKIMSNKQYICNYCLKLPVVKITGNCG